ncbi:Panacea domain-containing protein [Fusobacterium polymorphum]|nr:type II toxin-antitoxin system antitoxin SocA domain-containing protein [Fusobacterium polymorphum]WRL70008.1 type II toxin-antitoxin system antitoxin SocA domain-containing protein [Fusobacterium polymorphum]
MEKILNVAEYIFREYYRVTGELIDEMKLQKLLYFSQRETLAILNKPLFNEEFEGWKYGPISREIRTVFTEDGMNAETEDIKSDSKYIINNVILEYGALASWKLSELSHKEVS